MTITARFMTVLKENDYMHVREIPGGRWAGIYRFLFTTAIIVGTIDDDFNYDQRWCYHTAGEALEALDATDWSTPDAEPVGWHRHLPSGRRAGPDHEFNQALKEL